MVDSGFVVAARFVAGSVEVEFGEVVAGVVVALFGVVVAVRCVVGVRFGGADAFVAGADPPSGAAAPPPPL